MNLAQFPTTRLRRLRGKPQIRELVRETRLSTNDFILPIFVIYGEDRQVPIESMPGLYQWSVDKLPEYCEKIRNAGINVVMLFGIPETKDETGSSAWSDNGVVQRAARLIKQQFPELLVIADLCCCEYTDHGHCGIIKMQPTGQATKYFYLDNDATLEVLQKQTISLVKAGIDMIAPSGSIDGMVQAIRSALDEKGYTQIPILSYAVKYCSAMYGPFREAAGGSAPVIGDRSSYQMDPANGQEAIREAELDLMEGADCLMVKPAHTYLDVLANLKRTFPGVPMAGYQVSGEYAMLKAAAQKGWLDERCAFLEVMTAIKRAGADIIISYAALEIAQWLDAEKNQRQTTKI